MKGASITELQRALVGMKYVTVKMDSMAYPKATNDDVLGRGLSRQSSDFRRWMCDITSVPSSPESISRYNSNTLVPPSHALSTFKATPNRSQCTQSALPLLTQITSSGHQQQTLHPQ